MKKALQVQFMNEASTFLNGLEEKVRTKFGASITKTKAGFRGDWFEKMTGTDGIWEFRVQQAGMAYRLYAFWDGEG
ncbi:MAG: type II toxin-antitoxin system RelE/ParE family toxin, partial [Cytophagales bacterium]|nr:type II toxin-antitoxin system RelE/ParE family toxin [Cytophagales bacterium]